MSFSTSLISHRSSISRLSYCNVCHSKSTIGTGTRTIGAARWRLSTGKHARRAAPDENASRAPTGRLNVHLEPSHPSPSSLARTMPVTFHSYDDASDTPESVQGLVELMKRPLRNTQRLASLPSMSPLALAQLQRIPDRGSDADASTSEGSLNKISSVANLVLLTSKAIEESVHDRIEARRTISTSSTTQ